MESSKTKPLLKESVLEVVATIELPILHELHDPALKAVRKDGGIDRLCAQVQRHLQQEPSVGASPREGLDEPDRGNPHPIQPIAG